MKKFGLIKHIARWTKKEKDTLRENYAKRNNLAKLFPNRSKSSIYKAAFKMGLKRPFRKRTYLLNERFFDEWTNKSAYFLGWMYSDGNVTNNLRTIQLHIHKKDLAIIKKFKKCLKSTQKIFIRGDYVEFRVHSKAICKTLINLGCPPKKTHKLAFPTNIPKKYHASFVRGYFDGDGSIHFNKPNTIKIRIVGYAPFITKLKEKIEENKIYTTEVKNWSSCSGIELYGDNARRFCKWIYKDAEHLYLKRKYNRFFNHMKKRAENWTN
ncbi:MAG: hypothetical protein AABW59_00405 [archaeon]